MANLPHMAIGLWQPDRIIKRIEVNRPRLASWNAKTHPDQIALNQYLHDLGSSLGDVDQLGTDLGLDFCIQVEKPVHLLVNHDLENYLTPVVNHFGASRFRYVHAVKQVELKSALQLVATTPCTKLDLAWDGCFQTRMTGGASFPAWKHCLKKRIEQNGFPMLSDGAVMARMAWSISPRRNWVNLWKPTGDVLGSFLGYSRPHAPFHPKDDRIVDIEFHLQTDASLKDDIELAVWWKLL